MEVFNLESVDRWVALEWILEDQMSIILRESVRSAYQIPKGSCEPKWLKPLLTTHVKFYGSDNSDISQNYT